ADLNDQTSLITEIQNVKPDYIFHLAAQSYPQTSFTAPIDTLNTNILGTARLLESIRFVMTNDTNYKPIIHVCASSEVFGKIPAEKKPETGIHEECPFHPASPYAISKVGTDLLGRYYAEAYNMTVMTTRMFTHTGPRRGDVFHESTFAKQIAMIERDLIPPVVKVGNLKSLRTYADVRDAVRAYFMLVTHNPIPGEYYNIGGSYTCEVGDTLNTLISFSPMKDKIKIEVDPERLRPIDADLQIPDCRKFKAHTGWEPQIPYEKTMRDLLNYWRERVAKGENFLQR
ncbi:MAG: GDP-mannose 4,6-dehydratase, partial [Alphaproteobacteria bacterium]|nr:GDP-mannose 4,6-dehydratase [Alphaproteobacteria bacterium]